MRVLLAILCVTCSFASAAAQGNQAADQVPGNSSHSTGRTQLGRRSRGSPKAARGRWKPVRAARLLKARRDKHLPACRRLLGIFQDHR